MMHRVVVVTIKRVIKVKSQVRFGHGYRYHIGQGSTLPHLTTGIGAQRIIVSIAIAR